MSDDSGLKNDAEDDIVFNDNDLLKEVLGEVSLQKVKMKEFRPYNETISQVNEISIRWAHKDYVKTGDQTIVSYHDSLYVIEKFDSADMKYRIVGKLSLKNYQLIVERLKKYAKESEGKSAFEMVNDDDKYFGKGNRIGGKRSGTDDITFEHREKGSRIQGMDENQIQRKEISSNSRRNNAYDSANRQTQRGVKKSVAGTRVDDSSNNKYNKINEKLTRLEWKMFYSSLGELKRGMWFPQTIDGDYIFETHDKLIFYRRKL